MIQVNIYTILVDEIILVDVDNFVEVYIVVLVEVDVFVEEWVYVITDCIVLMEVLVAVVVRVKVVVEVRIGYVSVGGIESGVVINTQVGNGAQVSCNVRTSQQIHIVQGIPVLGGSCSLLEQAVRRKN